MSEQEKVVEDSTQENQEEVKEQPKVEDKDVTIKQSELDQLKKDATEYKDKHTRLYAEFENMRKRMERERSDFVKYANEEVVIELLGFLDNFERSIDAAKQKPDDVKVLIQGVEMMAKQIQELLAKHNAQPMEINVGDAFDHEKHEILMQEESDDHDEGAVLEVFQKGYVMGDRIVRTAKVKVAKK